MGYYKTLLINEQQKHNEIRDRAKAVGMQYPNYGKVIYSFMRGINNRWIPDKAVRWDDSILWFNYLNMINRESKPGNPCRLLLVLNSTEDVHLKISEDLHLSLPDEYLKIYSMVPENFKFFTPKNTTPLMEKMKKDREKRNKKILKERMKKNKKVAH